MDTLLRPRPAALAHPADEEFPPIADGFDDEAILDRLEQDDRNLEFDGETFVEKNVSVESSFVNTYIAHLLTQFCIANGWPAVALGPETIYRCWPDRPRLFRKPDVSVIRMERFREHEPNPRVMTIPADLVVEVLSPTNRAEDLNQKLELYREVGFGPVWVVSLLSRAVDVYQPSGETKRLRGDEVVDAGDVLPGFAPTVNDLLGPDAARGR
ncbi:MAG: Uma2 family endonuclease [Planctomycetota bacterium]